MTVNSKTVKDDDKFYSVTFTRDVEGVSKEIQEHRIINEDTARERAKAEFLENSYTRQNVTFTVSYADVEINDIISVYAPSFRVPSDLKKDKFIVKKVKHSVKDGALRTTIEALRYD